MALQMAWRIGIAWMLLTFLYESGYAAPLEAMNPSETQPTPSAAELVKEIVRDEAKFDAVRSFHLRMLGKWTRPPEAIKARIEELKKTVPEAEITAERFCDLRPTMVEELEIAFDEKRMRKLDRWHEARYELRVWDGQRLTVDERPDSETQEQYTFGNEPSGLGDLFANLTWLQMGPHSYSFSKNSETTEEISRIYGRPEDFQNAGSKEFRGHDCWILDNRQIRRRLFVGKNDHRLYGHVTFYLPSDAMTPAKVLEIASQVSGKISETETELNKTLDNLPEVNRLKLRSRIDEAMFDYVQPLAENYLDDYREIAPGLWFPEKQGYTLYDPKLKEHAISLRRDLRVVKVEVNKPLDDNLFTIPLQDGIQVYDERHDPPLIYKQKANRTEEEWQDMLDEAARNRPAAGNK